MKYILLFSVFWVLNASAQNEEPNPFVNIHPPTIASLMKNIDYPVDLYHGNPNISHTLYTLKDGAIELPITLLYNASGIKVDEEASWVGLGWNLNVGGMIMQHAIGRLDEKADYNITYPDSYPQGSFPAYLSLTSRINDAKKFETYYTKAEEGRLQPDVFYFTFPGGSGKFFIDYRDGSVHQIDAGSPLMIQEMNNGNSWLITTEDGTQHFFDGLATVWQDIGDVQRPVSRTFLLNCSIYPNGQSVSYQYETEKNTIFCRLENGEHIVKMCEGLAADMQCGLLPKITYLRTPADEALLKSITTDNYVIDFQLSRRNDLPAGRELDAMVIKARSASRWDSPERKICFDYSYFESVVRGNTWIATFYDTTGFFESDHLNKRLKLDAVYEADASGKKTNKLAFDYYNPTGMPPKTSFAVDYWGYYNGQTQNENLIPDFTKLYWKQSNNATLHQAGYVGNRACNPECLCNGMLKSVLYPTGGLMVYDYEPDEYRSDTFVPTCDEIQKLSFTDASPILSLRDRNVATDQTYGYFKVDADDKVKIRLHISKGTGSWTDLAGSNYVLLFTPINGYTRTFHTETFDLYGITEQYFFRTYEFTTGESGSFHFIISLPDALGDQSVMQSVHADFTGDVYVANAGMEKRGYNRGGGLRVKCVNHFETSDTSQPPILSYSYHYPDVGGVLFTPIAFDRTYENLHYCQIKDTHNNLNLNNAYGTDGIELSLSSCNFHAAPYSTVGVAVCYPEVKVSKTRFGVSQGYTVHSFKTVYELTTEYAFQRPDVGSGKPIAVEHYNEGGILLQSETYDYDIRQRHFYSGAILLDNFNRSPRFYTFQNNYLVRMIGGDECDNYTGRYMSMLYGITSTSCLPKSQTLYRDGVTTTTTYVYDSHCQLKKESVTGSDGKEYDTTYTYPYDFNFAPYTSMAAKNFLAYPVEVKQLVDGKLSGSKLTQYGIFNGMYLPVSVAHGKFTGLVVDTATFSASGSSSVYYPAMDATFLRYDAYANPVHVRAKGEDIIYVWGYNYQYPVAEIRKSSYGAVQSALGDAPENFSPKVLPPLEVNDLQEKLPDAQVSLYTYTPLLGMKTKTAPNGEVTNFEYDGFGRLTKTLDNDRKTIEEYDYHYKN